jgi:hypothetical protein
MTSKKCSKCKKVLDLDNFNRNSASRDGFINYCKGCRREYVAQTGIASRATKKYMKAADVGIYRIGSKTTGQFYIGRGWINERRIDHFTKLKSGKHHNGYLQTLYNQRPQDIVFEVLEKIQDQDARVVERDYIIAAFIQDNTKVLNQHITLRWE